MELHLAPSPPGLADVDCLVSGYCSAWNEADPDRRLRRLQAIWCDDSTFEGPAAHVRGARGLSAYIGACSIGRSGWRFDVADVTAHGRHVLLSWKLLDATGRERLCGHDVGECGDDRRLRRVVSFWHTEPVG
jgi:hypothetical protein